jgi:(1->4)-alpha-D-glucan 1-alpha-D-glucosylmutase
MESSQALRELAVGCGIVLSFEDVFKTVHETSDEALRHVLGAMGLNVQTDDDVRQTLARFQYQQWSRWVDPVLVLRQNALPAHIVIRIPESLTQKVFQWELRMENGETFHGDFNPTVLREEATCRLEGQEPIHQYTLRLPVTPEIGYHTFSLSLHNGGAHPETATLMLAIAPDQCYMPPLLAQGGKTWGPAVQLYALKSRRNWGMGDFTDLQTLLRWSHKQGAGVVGINPIHELFPHNAYHISPYAPSSRQFFNSLYLDIAAIAEYQTTPGVKEEVESSEFQTKLQELRDREQVDHVAVANLKRPLLERMYHTFQELHLNRQTQRAEDFRAYCERGGQRLENLAVYQAMHEHFYHQDWQNWGWPVWPEAYRTPDKPAVKEFANQHRNRVEYFKYLQFLVHEQLCHVQQVAKELGMPVGLYTDLAVGCDRAGADVWCDQDVYAFDASVGAPPDAFNMLGQNWGLPPVVPTRWKDSGYGNFIAMLRQNMQYSGALRFDHALALFRLFWIPPGMNATQGAYVSYPCDDLLGILALESHRYKCLVIGEDLGTIPDFVYEKLAEWGVLSYKVFLFEKNPKTNQYKTPEEYPRLALVTVSTHDLPTLYGYWHHHDISVRAGLNLFPSPEVQENAHQERKGDRHQMLLALKNRGLIPADANLEPDANGLMTPELAQTLHRYLAETPSMLQMVQLEDLLGQRDQMNMPGTTDEHPNWRQKIHGYLEDLDDNPAVATTLASLKSLRNPLPV